MFYTDQELDGSTGLYNYDARLYDPVIGRFLSADPFVQAPLNPQSFNRYSYVFNNPLIYIDPTGYNVEDWYDTGTSTEEGDVIYGDDEGRNGYTDSDGFTHIGESSGSNDFDYSDGTGNTSPAYENFHGHDNEPAGGTEYYAMAKHLPGSRRMVFYPGNEIFTNLPRGGGLAGYGGAPKVRGKMPVPKTKSSPFGPKIADQIPKSGVPKNWSKAQIRDAISDYRTSIASRRAELRAFDAVGRGSATQRLAHARRITQEESFLRSLEKALRSRR